MATNIQLSKALVKLLRHEQRGVSLTEGQYQVLYFFGDIKMKLV